MCHNLLSAEACLSMRHTTLGRTPFDEGSARCRYLYSTKKTTLTRGRLPCPRRNFFKLIFICLQVQRSRYIVIYIDIPTTQRVKRSAVVRRHNSQYKFGAFTVRRVGVDCGKTLPVQARTEAGRLTTHSRSSRVVSGVVDCDALSSAPGA
jgi:hypothetical protein